MASEPPEVGLLSASGLEGASSFGSAPSLAHDWNFQLEYSEKLDEEQLVALLRFIPRGFT